MAQPGDDGDGWSYFPIHTIPKSLDVVWCRFPELAPDIPGPKCRPGIVRSVELGRGQTIARVEVCYGTSKLKKDLYPYDLFVENLSQLNLIGLPQATRFELGRTIKLPWAKEFFEPRDGSRTPINGRSGHVNVCVTIERGLQLGHLRFRLPNFSVEPVTH